MHLSGCVFQGEGTFGSGIDAVQSMDHIFVCTLACPNPPVGLKARRRPPRHALVVGFNSETCFIVPCFCNGFAPPLYKEG
ncbi:unnamed protein product [Danaus chrysippus]|uniref:(African queen) hypothetical protein n=1 Tax=Danaus chrysippus TaxID=151541 RepID=A0A8J2QJK4_9NEOP|nr:unnamed protein product [Danaus chrysippus]